MRKLNNWCELYETVGGLVESKVAVERYLFRKNGEKKY